MARCSIIYRLCHAKSQEAENVKKKYFLYLHFPQMDHTTLPWSRGHTSHLRMILIVIFVPFCEKILKVFK